MIYGLADRLRYFDEIASSCCLPAVLSADLSAEALAKEEGSTSRNDRYFALADIFLLGCILPQCQ
jgi:hypothetical protein